jgi:hypothetical protein
MFVPEEKIYCYTVDPWPSFSNYFYGGVSVKLESNKIWIWQEWFAFDLTQIIYEHNLRSGKSNQELPPADEACTASLD